MALAAWTTTYAIFFLRGGSLLDWLRGQKWTLDFYLHASHGGSWLAPLMVWITSLTGWYQSQSAWVSNTGWNLLLAFFVLLAGRWLWRRGWRQENRCQRYTWLLAWLLLAANMLTSFYPRYLLLILPLAVLLVAQASQSWAVAARRYGVMVIFFQALLALIPLPATSWRETIAWWTSQHYHDLYASLTPDSTASAGWREFHQQRLITDDQLRTQSLTLDYNPWTLVWPWQPQVRLPVTITRTLTSGHRYAWEAVTTWRRRGLRWELIWSDELVAPGHQEGDTYTVTYQLEPPPLLYIDETVVGQASAAGELWVDKNQLTDTQIQTFVPLLEANGLARQVTWENRLWAESEGLTQVRLAVLLEPEQITRAQALVASASALTVRESESDYYPAFASPALAARYHAYRPTWSRPDVAVTIWRTRDGQTVPIWSAPAAHDGRWQLTAPVTP